MLSESESRSVMSDSLQLHGLYSPWNSPGKTIGVGCHVLLQGIFPTQGSDLRLLFPALAGGFFTTSATWEALLYAQFSSIKLIFKK